MVTIAATSYPAVHPAEGSTGVTDMDMEERVDMKAAVFIATQNKIQTT